MGKKKAFIDKKNAKVFRLVPDRREKSETFKPTPEHIEEQQKYGVFFDDNYDYLQHLRGVNEPMKLQDVNEEVERETFKAPSSSQFPIFGLVGPAKEKDTFDEDIANALNGRNVAEDGLEDNFIELAGGLLDEKVTSFRERQEYSDEDDDDDEYDDMYDNYNEDEGYDESKEVVLTREDQREIDEQFEGLMDREYNDDQIGELDGDDYDIGGCLEPNSGRLHKLATETGKILKNDDDDDEKIARELTKERFRLIEEGKIKDKSEMETVEVEESTRKRMKWDCESFATQYTNIYNHPTLIKDSGLSRRALKKFNKQVEEMDIAEEEEEEDEGDEEEKMEDDDCMSQFSTVSTIRVKGETSEQRRLRKAAVKEARRMRRIEKKANKTAFAEEGRKMAKGRIGQIKARPL